MCHIIRDMAQVTELPIIAKPNAGMPVLDQTGATVYNMDKDTFSREMAGLIEAGAFILGGCCGTTPEYIKKLVETTGHLSTRKREKKNLRFLASERQALSFSCRIIL